MKGTWDEEGVHAFLAKTLGQAGGRAPIHDAVVTSVEGGRLAVCCDRTEQGVHFTEAASMQAVAHKAVGRSLSDLAATAAEPFGLMLALAAPKGFDGQLLEQLLGFVAARGAELGAPLLGGDTSACGTGLSLVVTAMGVAPVNPPGRDRLVPGQVIALTGPVGGSRAGRHLWIEPRLEAGRRLHGLGARAMMDVSDGLALDLARLADASGVGVELVQVPLHPDVQAIDGGPSRVEHGLFDGEDHELMVGLEEAEALAAGLWPVARVLTDSRKGLWLAEGLGECERRALPGAAGEATAFERGDSRGYVHGR